MRVMGGIRTTETVKLPAVKLLRQHGHIDGRYHTVAVEKQKIIAR